MLIGPFKRSSIFFHFVKWLAIDVEVLDVAAIKPKASNKIHYISFALRLFRTL